MKNLVVQDLVSLFIFALLLVPPILLVWRGGCRGVILGSLWFWIALILCVDLPYQDWYQTIYGSSTLNQSGHREEDIGIALLSGLPSGIFYCLIVLGIKGMVKELLQIIRGE